MYPSRHWNPSLLQSITCQIGHTHAQVRTQTQCTCSTLTNEQDWARPILPRVTGSYVLHSCSVKGVVSRVTCGQVLKAFSLKPRILPTGELVDTTRQAKLSRLVKAACRYDVPLPRSQKLIDVYSMVELSLKYINFNLFHCLLYYNYCHGHKEMVRLKRENLSLNTTQTPTPCQCSSYIYIKII